MRARLNARIIIPLIAVCLLAVFAVVGAVSMRELTTSPAGRDQGVSSDVASTEKSLGITSPSTSQPGAAAEAQAGGAASDAERATAAVQAAANQKLIRTGQLSLLIPQGKLLATVDRVAAMTAGMGGYVMSSSVGGGIAGGTPLLKSGVDDTLPAESESSTSTPAIDSVSPSQAWLTLRVPTNRFESAVKRFSELGGITAISTSSDDVTAQYVDLQAQLRHNRAVERRLLRFLAQTDTIREMLLVQDRIDAVQLTIEQLEAQLKSLRETTTYATLTVSLEERGTPQPGQIDDSDTFAGVLWNSLTLLGHGARLTALAVTAALPFVVVFAVLGLCVWYGVRRLRARRQAQQPTLPA